MALQTYQGKRTQCDQRRRRAAAGRASGPTRTRPSCITNTNFQVGGPLILKNKLFFFGSANYQATHVNVPGFPAVVPSYLRVAAVGHERSGHDRHPRRRREDHLSARSGEPLRGLPSKQRYDKPNRGARCRHDAGLGLEGARHLRDHPACLQPGAQRPHVPRQQGQLQQHALPAVPEDRPAADHRQHHERALSEPEQQPADVPPPLAGDRQLAVLPAAVRSAAGTSSRPASTTATRRRTSTPRASTTST